MHDQLALLIEKLIEYLLLGLSKGNRVERRALESMLGLLINTLNRLHDVVAIEPHAELRDLKVVTNRLSDTHQQPVVFWCLFVDLPPKEVIG